MDFKTRFQGKMTRISKDGGIDDMVKTAVKPINRVEKVTIRSLQIDQPGGAEAISQQNPKISYGGGAQANSIATSPRQQFLNYNAADNLSQNQQQQLMNQTPINQNNGGLYSTQQSNFGLSVAASSPAPANMQQMKRPLPQGFSSSRHDQSFASQDARQDGTVYSNAKTSFYSNMQQSAARQQQVMLSPAQNRQSIGSGGSFSVTDNQFAQNIANGVINQQFKSGGFSNFQRPIPTNGPQGTTAYTQMSIQDGGAAGQQAVNQSSSITMRLLQQKQARESQRTQNGAFGVDTPNNNEINLYAANPFGGLQAPVAVSSGESDQTYNMGARTQYGGLQNSSNQGNNALRPDQIDAQNPMVTHGSKFIAVQDSATNDHGSAPMGHPSQSPVIQTHIKGPRQANTSDKYSASQGRTSQNLRADMEENRKRNLVNVSQHILSPSQHSKAFSEQKGSTRPPSHPGPMKGTHPGAAPKATSGIPLAPKVDPTVKRTNSYVVKSSSSVNRNLMGAVAQHSYNGKNLSVPEHIPKNVQIRQQNVVFSQNSNRQQAPETMQQAQKTSLGNIHSRHQTNQLRQNRIAQRANSISGTMHQRGEQQNHQNQQNINQADSTQIINRANLNDDSLFGQFANEDEFKPPVMDLAESPIPRMPTPGGASSTNQTVQNTANALSNSNAENFQMQMNMMQQQMLQLMQQQQQYQMSGNLAGMTSLTDQMQKLQQMQINLQKQMTAVTPASGQQRNTNNRQQRQTLQDDNSFLNEDLPDLTSQIMSIPDNTTTYAAQQQHQQSSQSRGERRQKSQLNNQNNNINSTASQFRPYKQRDFNIVKQQTQNTKLGGLGANIGGEEWEKAQQKKQAQKQYAEQVRMQTQHNPLPRKPKPAPVREMTAREKALEFAKNVPKPKPTSKAQTNADGGDPNQRHQSNQDNNLQEEDHQQQMGYMGTGDTGTLDFVEHNQEMNEAVAKNLDLADEVAKIKASMFQ